MKSSKDEAAKLNTVRHSLIILYYDMGMGDQIYILIYPKINVYSKKKKNLVLHARAGNVYNKSLFSRDCNQEYSEWGYSYDKRNQLDNGK